MPLELHQIYIPSPDLKVNFCLRSIICKAILYFYERYTFFRVLLKRKTKNRTERERTETEKNIELII